MRIATPYHWGKELFSPFYFVEFSFGWSIFTEICFGSSVLWCTDTSTWATCYVVSYRMKYFTSCIKSVSLPCLRRVLVVSMPYLCIIGAVGCINCYKVNKKAQKIILHGWKQLEGSVFVKISFYCITFLNENRYTFFFP